jgi:hypothetical protein
MGWVEGGARGSYLWEGPTSRALARQEASQGSVAAGCVPGAAACALLVLRVC